MLAVFRYTYTLCGMNLLGKFQIIKRPEAAKPIDVPLTPAQEKFGNNLFIKDRGIQELVSLYGNLKDQERRPAASVGKMARVYLDGRDALANSVAKKWGLERLSSVKVLERIVSYVREKFRGAKLGDPFTGGNTDFKRVREILMPPLDKKKDEDNKKNDSPNPGIAT